MLHCRVCIDTVRQWCDSQADFELIGALNTATCDLTVISKCRPDVLLLDLDLPCDIVGLVTQLRRQLPYVRIVVSGAKWSDLVLSELMGAGVHGVLLKSESVESLFEHVRHVARGAVRVSAELVDRVRYDAQRQQYVLASPDPLTSLTDQQLEILRLLACGDSLKMVASKLKLSKKSIDGHKYRMMRKLGVKDRVLLSRLAIREGLIQA
jgi:DNA-binding NarL/FixJ family response regulator